MSDIDEGEREGDRAYGGQYQDGVDYSVPTDADVLAAAVDYIEQYGWHQGDYFSAESEEIPCSACGWGGVLAACYRVASTANPYILTDEATWRREEEQIRRINYALDYVVGPEYSNHFPTYNDRKGRTWEEVKALMLNVVSDLRLTEEAAER